MNSINENLMKTDETYAHKMTYSSTRMLPVLSHTGYFPSENIKLCPEFGKKWMKFVTNTNQMHAALS